MRRLKIALLLVAIKCLWILTCTGHDDLRSRLAYLRHRHLAPDFFGTVVASPGGIFEGEWRLLSLSMTAAAATNMFHRGELEHQQAIALVDGLIAKARCPEARAFDSRMWGSDALDTLDTNEGHVGYLGHLAFMMAARLTLAPDPGLEAELTRITGALARRMKRSASHHIETYPGEIYTADNSVAVAAIALHARAEHAELIASWVAFTREHLRSEHGLIVFGLDARHQPRGRGRGSAAGYNSFYLPFVDETLAAEQRRAMREHLHVDVLGAQAFREHADGFGIGDVDSGPLVFGLSPAATGFGMASARHAGDRRLLDGLLLTAEIAGFTIPTPVGRCYLLAPLVGDAIVLAMRTATRWPTRAPPSSAQVIRPASQAQP